MAGEFTCAAEKKADFSQFFVSGDFFVPPRRDRPARERDEIKGMCVGNMFRTMIIFNDKLHQTNKISIIVFL